MITSTRSLFLISETETIDSMTSFFRFRIVDSRPEFEPPNYRFRPPVLTPKPCLYPPNGLTPSKPKKVTVYPTFFTFYQNRVNFERNTTRFRAVFSLFCPILLWRPPENVTFLTNSRIPNFIMFFDTFLHFFARFLQLIIKPSHESEQFPQEK